VAFFIYSDAIGTIIRMATTYGTMLRIPRDAMIAAILVTQIVGFPFAFVFGMLAGRIGVRPSIYIGIVVYCLISVIGYFMTTATHFLMLAALVGLVQGGTQALSRSLFSTLVPRHKSGEFFGFWGVIERFSGFFGTTLMWVVAAFTGSPRLGILLLIVFFLAGGLLLSRVDIGAGQKAAKDAERAAGVAVI